MCGISGIINLDKALVDKQLLENANNALIHRGPDEDGLFIDKFVGLAHRRLSIIDLKSGQQPMQSANEKFVIVFNGEIYNFCELCKKLSAKGYQFKTNSDTEVLLYLYQEYEEKMLDLLNGMFAFTIYDKIKNKVFIARDRLGQKPLFYFKTKKSFMFASELQALKTHPEMDNSYNLQSLHDELSYLYIPAPSTIYNNVFKLEPGNYLSLDLISMQHNIVQYWKVDFSKKTDISFSDAKLKLRELLTNSVRQRMISDVPYGAFLSGGIDSTIITGLMCELCNDNIQSFSIGFNSKLYNETSFSQLATEHFNKLFSTQVYNNEKIVQPNDIKILRKLMKHCGEPYSDSSILPSFMLSQWTKNKVTVALSGDGADELFAGYDRYFIIKLSKFINIIPFHLRKAFLTILSKILPKKIEERSVSGKIQRILNLFSQKENCQYLTILNRFPDSLKHQLYGEQFKDFKMLPSQHYIDELSKKATASNFVEKFMELDINSYLHNDILTKVDVSSMANSLEVRSPFLDYKVVEFAQSLPLSYKLKGNQSKYILKEAFSDLLPHEITNRKKAGFGVPVAEWFRNDWNKDLKENLLDGISVKDNYFKRVEVEKLINKHQNKQADHSYSLWTLLTFELFLQES